MTKIYPYREEMLKIAMEFVVASKLKGDYLEFGIYQGSTFTTAFHFAQKKNLNLMKFYAFDAFKGLPEIEGVDAEGFRHFSKGQYACEINIFKKIISEKGVDLNKIIIVPGWYKDTLNKETKNKLQINKASIIYVDCDLYESTVLVLNFITDYIQDGTLLIFDDWFCFRGDPNKGEQRAFREWLKRNSKIKANEYHKFGYHGNSFILNVKE